MQNWAPLLDPEMELSVERIFQNLLEAMNVIHWILDRKVSSGNFKNEAGQSLKIKDPTKFSKLAIEIF